MPVNKNKQYPYYSIYMGSLVLHRSVHEEVICNEGVAVLFDRDGGFLIKHGELTPVKDYHATLTKAFSGLKSKLLKSLADDTILLHKVDWDPELLNKFIHISGYIGIWYKEQEEC